MAEIAGIIILSLVVCYPIFRLTGRIVKKSCKCCEEEIIDDNSIRQYQEHNNEVVGQVTPQINNVLEEIEHDIETEDEYYDNEEEQEHQTQKSIKEFISSNTNVTKYKESANGQKECIICLEEFKGNQNIRLLQCMHYFHKKCIDEWLNNNTICPECQHNIIPK